MGMIPGSSTEEHSAVNYTAEQPKPLLWRRLATKLSPLVVPQLCPASFEQSIVEEEKEASFATN